MPPSAAPWKPVFNKHIASLSATPRFHLSTVSLRNGIASPRCRILLYRGFYGELEATPYNKAPLNPKGYSSDLLSYTTDTRMHKVSQLGGEGNSENSVEAVFWIGTDENGENPNKGYQWRIRGSSVVLPRTADEKTKAYIFSHLRNTEGGGGDGEEFDIDKETTAHFGNISPVIQKSFKQPLPGVPKEKRNDDPELGPNQPVDGLHDKVARRNFRVCVVEARRVELVDLTNSPARKWVWVRKNSEEEREEGLESYGEVEGDWRKVELFP